MKMLKSQTVQNAIDHANTHRYVSANAKPANIGQIGLVSVSLTSSNLKSTMASSSFFPG
jgi:hypothetical protein